MKTGYHRKKQPELVKSEILKAAIELSTKSGLSGITVQAVADLAGVTKGGLLHHFSSKQELIEGVFNHLLEALDNEIDAQIAKDKKPYGSFTRAYIRSSFSTVSWGESNPWPALAVSIVADPTLRQLWYGWLKGRLAKHKATDSGLEMEIARLAADGVWLNLIDGATHAVDIFSPNLEKKLIEFTKEKSK